jgi:predicted ribosomally synthesized peptide with SipW-like signal peptide
MTQKRGAKRRTARRASSAKLFGSLAAVSLVAVVGVVGTRAALSATTDNTANQFNAGEISLADNDAGSFLYQVDNALPGDPPVSKCIKVSYTSTPNLNSTVALYMGGTIDTVGPYVNLTIDAGTQSSPVFPDCTGFSSTQNLYTGTLADFATTHGTSANGVTFSPNGATPWKNGDSVVYKVTVGLSNATRPAGADYSGPHTYTWQATTAP